MKLDDPRVGRARFNLRAWAAGEMLRIAGAEVVCATPKERAPLDATVLLEYVEALERRVSELERPSITCPLCGLRSYNPNDVREMYCGRCKVFHDGNEVSALALHALRRTAERVQQALRAADDDPGWWGVESGARPGHLVYPDEGSFADVFGETEVAHAVAEHIAAFSPAVVLELIKLSYRAKALKSGVR